MPSSFSQPFPRLVQVLCVCALGCSLAAAAPSYGAAPLVDPSVVPLYVGQEVTVEAWVQAARREGNVVRLELEQVPHPVEVVLVEGLLTRFPPNPEGHFSGKKIRASGTIREFRGHWEIVVRDPQNIALVSGAGEIAPPPAAQSAIQASPGVPGPPRESERWREVESRLERLEAEVRELRAATLTSAPTPDDPNAANCHERLRKVELRVRQLEQKFQGRR